MSKWPQKGASPVARARAMFLAMRVLAEEQERGVALLRKIRADMHPRSPLRDSIDDVLDALDGMETVEELNTRFHNWGEDWHVPLPDLDEFDDDDMVPSKIAALFAQLNRRHLANLRMFGRIEGHWNEHIGPQGGWTYKVSDAKKLGEEIRARGGKAWRANTSLTNIPANGTGDSE